MPRPLAQEASVAGQEAGSGQRGLRWAVRSEVTGGTRPHKGCGCPLSNVI